MSSFLRIGWIGVPIRIEVDSSDLLPDCTAVTGARFRVYRGSAPQVDPEIWTDVTISGAQAASYLATHLTVTNDTAQRDTLRIYVDSTTDGVNWITTESPVIVPVIDN